MGQRVVPPRAGAASALVGSSLEAYRLERRRAPAGAAHSRGDDDRLADLVAAGNPA